MPPPQDVTEPPSHEPGSAVIDLNADLGEEVTDDAALIEVVTSANVACGGHAGDADIMRRVCSLCAGRGVAVGAQVSYVDREGFGRRRLDVSPDRLREQVAEQLGALAGIAREEGTVVVYLKPHGALYHRVYEDEEQAGAVLAATGDLPVLGMPGAVILRLAREAGRRTVHEGFPDRGYTEEGRLVPRDEPGALVEGAEAVAENAVRMARTGEVASVCVHGDSPGAVDTARRVRAALEAAGVRLRAAVR